MKKRRETSFALLSLAVVVPLLALAALAWLGIALQVESAKDAGRKAGEMAAEPIVFHITTSLEPRFRAIPSYPDPPPPGPPAAANGQSDNSDIKALTQARDSTSEKVSPGGLPLRVIAAARLFELTRSRNDAEQAVRLATVVSPSVLTPKVLAEINEVFPDLGGPAQLDWKVEEEARRLADGTPDLDARGAWRGDFLLEKSSAGPRYIHLDNLVAAVEQAKVDANIGSYFDLRVSIAGRVVSGPGSSATEERWAGRSVIYGFGDIPLATVPLPFGERVQLDILAKDITTIERLVRRQAFGAGVVLAAALVAAAFGLCFMHRLVARERRLNAMKSDFVASVSHELRAPIASIRLMADALEGGKIEERTAGEFHRLISREGARLSTLIENVLDFARIEQGRKQWHFEETDLRALIGATSALMEPLARERNIALVTEEPPETASARIDPGAIQQALVNLLDNAIKFSPPDSQVGIRLSENSATGRWEIAIMDNGPGIPRVEHGRIFEKFHRLGGELRRETQGTGIGLSLVKAITEAHGGAVSVESEPGRGSTFTLTLPAV